MLYEPRSIEAHDHPLAKAELKEMRQRIEELERDLAEVAGWYQTALKRIAELERRLNELWDWIPLVHQRAIQHERPDIYSWFHEESRDA